MANAIYQSPPWMAGYSVEQRPIECVCFGPSPEGPWEVFFMGVIHGDEGIAGELLQAFQSELAAYPERYQVLLGSRTVGILPVLNPDGLAKETRTNAHGVDLNRNCPTACWQVENQETPYYSGPEAASEPETRLFIEMVEKYQPKKIVAVHSPYKVINYDGPAQALAEAMSERCGYPAVADIGYPTPGSMGTYIGKERNIPMITLELPEDEPLEKVWQETKEALIAAVLFPA